MQREAQHLEELDEPVRGRNARGCLIDTSISGFITSPPGFVAVGTAAVDGADVRRPLSVMALLSFPRRFACRWAGRIDAHKVVGQQFGLLGRAAPGRHEETASRCSIVARIISRDRPCNSGPTAE